MDAIKTASLRAPSALNTTSPPRFRGGRGRTAGLMALVLVLCAVPFVVDGYRSFQVATILLYAVALIGLNLLTGYNGQISLGHGAFFALGGYVTAILSATFGVPFWLTVPLAGLVGLIVGFLFGLPALRLGSLYLALATFSLALAVPQLLKWKSAEFITGGVLGIALQKPSVPAWLPLTQDQLLYLFTLLVAVVMYVLAHNLVNSRIGRALIAIRERPIAATAAGINVAIVKSTTFGVSVMFTAVAGALSALLVQYVAPDSFSLMLSITMLVGIIVGGTASLAGPVVGAIFITLIPNVAESISKSAPGAIYGACLLIVVLCMPRGIWGAVQSVVHRFCRRKAVGSSKVP